MTRSLQVAARTCRRRLYATVQQGRAIENSPNPTGIHLSPSLKLRNDLRQLIRIFEQDFSNQRRWLDRLRWALDATECKPRRTITVIGDHLSGSRSLADALLQDPFQTSGSWDEAFRLRRLQANETLRLSYSPAYQLGSNRLELPSPWLREHDTDLVEAPIASSRAQLPEELLDVIYRSTVVVLALTDVHALADFEPLLNHIKEHPHVIITCDALLMPSGEALNQVHEQLRFLLQRKQLHWPILPFHSHYAKKALELVRNPKSASNNLGLFADAFGQAGLVTVSEQLAFALRQSSAQSETSDVSLPARFIADSARGSALELNFASQTKAHEAMNALKVCSGYLASLRSNAETALGLITANGVQKLDLPESASVQGKAAMEAILAKRLNWWRLPWGRADDIYGDLAQASQSFFRDAENNLSFAAGRLAALQQQVNTTVEATLKTTPFTGNGKHETPLLSPVLENQAEQLAARAGSVTADTLNTPIFKRRSLLTLSGGPIEHLQLKGQQAVLQFYTLVSSSIGVSYAAAMTSHLQVNVATATGTLGSALAFWLLQRSWIKSVKRFWQNYARCEAGLAYDLHIRARDALDAQIFGKSSFLLRGLQKAAQKRLQHNQQLALELESDQESAIISTEESLSTHEATAAQTVNSAADVAQPNSKQPAPNGV